MLRTTSAHEVALLDWLACACAGRSERAAQAMRSAAGDGLLADVAFAATAGHVLDYDDTFAEGVAHVSAAVAPAALVVAAELGRTVADALQAYAAGFEAMAALTAACHPQLYERGWHPTAVCAPAGAAVAAAELLGCHGEERARALALALLRTGGGRGAFGSDGKAIQVGQAVAAGVQAVLLAQAGAVVDEHAVTGSAGVAELLELRAPLEVLAGRPRPAAGLAIERNWIKLHPSCLGTHAPIDAADTWRRGHDGGEAGTTAEVTVHPRARQAAHLDAAVQTGLQAKFSIPYCVAWTLLHGPPVTASFSKVDPQAVRLAESINLSLDEDLPEFGARLSIAGSATVELESPRGSPAHPASPEELAAKVHDLAGDRLDGVLDDPGAPAARPLEAAGLSPVPASRP